MTMTIKGEKASVEIGDGLEKAINDLIKDAAPEAIAIIHKKLEGLKAEAVANWPVRQKVRIMRDDTGAIVKTKSGKTVVFKNPPSKRSIDKFEITRQLKGSKLELSLANSAPYAYLIRMGIDTKGRGGAELFMPLGARAADYLIMKPSKKVFKDLAKEYAAALMKLQKGE